MQNTYTCFLHKAGVMTPDLRIVVCGVNDNLPEKIVAAARYWPRFEVLDVYDDQDQPLYRFTVDDSQPN